MNLRASENIRLFGMKVFFNEITNLYKLKKMPTKILLSGKKGLGKSTLANLVEIALHKQGLSTYILDGDNIRQGINKDLSFNAW